MVKKSMAKPVGEVLLYQTEDGVSRLEVRVDARTLWLSQMQMVELFQTTKQNLSKHIRKIYEEGELSREATVNHWLTVRSEGGREVRRQVEHYNLDAIISIGYRVKSHRGTQFRIWATQQLREYIVKGFALDDARLKRANQGNYFEELLARIRDVRSSEKMFWRKVLDIYATSVDYTPNTEASRKFFVTVQNKMHWAVHGQTAAEVVVRRADASKPNMGMTSWLGERPRKEDAPVAKNYLATDELDALNRIVNAYLEFAELRALNRKPMYMADWSAKLDEFLRMSERELLSHAGTVSHEAAVEMAEREYEAFRAAQASLPSRVERDFEVAIKKLPTPNKRKKS